MYRSILQVAILVLLSVCAQAQTLRFTVLEKESRQPIELAYVNVYELPNNAIQNTVQTDVMGLAELPLNKYPCKIEIVLQGYERYEREFVSAPLNTSMTIALGKKYSLLDEVVVTGVSEPVRIKDALSSYKVITRAMIDAQGAVTLNEALKNQLNMTVGNDGILGSTLRMQNMGGEKIKVLIDGMPVNGRENGNINLSQINMNNVERIEVIQGPMSVVYGTDALGGVINVITKKEHKKIGGRINTYYESVGRYNVDGAFTYKLKEKHQFTLGGGRNFFQGYQSLDTPMTANGQTARIERSYYFKPNEQYIANLAYGYSAKSGFKLNVASDFLKEKVINKGGMHVFNAFEAKAFDEYYHTTRSINRLSTEGKVGKTGKWQSQNSYAVYYRIKTKWNTDLVTMNRELTEGKGDQDTSLFQTYTFRGNYSNKWGRLSYTAGYDVNLDFARSLKIQHGDPKMIQDYAVFGNASYGLIKDKLTLQGGLRAAYNTTYHPPVIPSVNLLYTPISRLQLRASYSKGYRAPALKEMYLSFIDDNHEILGNINLRPEESNHGQLSASYQFYEKGSDYLQLVATGFYNDVKNGIVLVPTRPWDSTSIEYAYKNFSHQSNAIGNLQLDGRLYGLHFVLGYAYNYTFEEKGNYKAFGAIELNGSLQYAVPKTGINLNLFYKYTGSQPALITNIDGTVTYSGNQKAFGICDASIEKKFVNNKLQIIAGIKNVMDVRNRRVTGIPMSNGAHGNGSTGFFIPRSFFTSLHLIID